MSIYTWRGSLKRQYTKIAQRYDNRVLRAHLNFKRFLTTFANYQQSTCYVHKMTLVNLKDIVNLYFTKFAVICLSPSISPSNQHINGCFILTENWYALPMVFFLLLGTQNKMTRYHILKYLGPKACQSTCSYFVWSRNI